MKTAAFQTKLDRGCNLYSMEVIKTSVAVWFLSSGETKFPSYQLMWVRDEDSLHLQE